MATINLSKYRNNWNYVKYLYDHSNHKDLGKLVSECAVATTVPCIVIAYFLEEIHGKCEALDKSKAALVEFYNYEDIQE